MAFDIKGTIVNVLLPILLGELEKAAETGIDKAYEAEPKWTKTSLQVAYILLKEHAQEFVASTENNYDDKALASALEIITTEAEKLGITLPV